MTRTKTTATVTCIIACEVFRAAFNYLNLEDRYSHLCITYLPARLHLKPLELRKNLLREVKKARERCDRIICVYGDCFPEITNFCKRHKILKVRGFNCYEMFLGSKRFNKLLDEVTGTYFVEESIITNFDESCVKPLELHDEEILSNDSLNTIVPDDPKEPYDMHEVIYGVLDDDDFLEVQEHFAPNIIVGFGRLTGYTVGVVANQPMSKAGVLDINSSDKASRFIRFCNAFNIPILTFVDVPGFMPGVQQEYGGIIRHGAKMLFAYAAATVPKLTLVVRKAYGGAYLAMCAKSMGADTLCAWPTAEIAVMGAEGAVNVLHRKEIAAAENADTERAKKIEEYKDTFANPYFAASRGLVDEILGY